MGRVYSYLRFSDPKQAAGSSADRQLEYARRWAEAHGMVLDESLSMRDEGLSAYHQRHLSHGALGVFLRAVDDGRIEPGSVLIVEGLDRLSRAEPFQAQAQLAQIINAGMTVVTAQDGQTYSREIIKDNPYRLIHSLVVQIRAHEESDTKSKRVRAAIRRQCEGWLAGTWRGIIRNGKDPHWVAWNGAGFALVEDRAAAVREAVRMYMDGLGGVEIIRRLTARGMRLSDAGKTTNNSLHALMRKRLLLGEKRITLDGQTYDLPGYYPALVTPGEWDALQVQLDRRSRRRGPAQIPSLFTGLGIAVCGYCGGAISTSNMMSRARRPDGLPWPGHRRLACNTYAQGGPCPCPGTIQAAPVERAVMLLCADQLRMDGLLSGGDQGAMIRADLAATRGRIAQAESSLDRLARALAQDDGPTPITLLRQMRDLEAQVAKDKAGADALERELAAYRPTATRSTADEWMSLIDGIEALDRPARLRAREMVRESFSRIVLWHRGDPAGVEGGEVLDLEITARGGGTVRLRVDRQTGGVLDQS